MLRAQPLALLVVLLSACGSAGPGSDGGTGTTDAEQTDGGPVVPEDSMLGCPAGQTCRLLFVSQSFDDRVEIFAPDDPVAAYRGAIDLDLRPGTGTEELDEPVGIAITDEFVHVVAGHYPVREEGTLVSIPRAMLGEYDAGATVVAAAILSGGAFQAPVVATAFGVPEPIFVLPRPVLGRLLIGTFNNDLFAPETEWTAPGMLQLVDAADPTQFGTATLTDLEGSGRTTDCNGAAQVVTLEDDTHVAVACDGNETVAFLDLTGLGTASPEIEAEAITGKVCPLPPFEDRRVRYLAHDGAGGVLVGLGPGLESQTSSGQIYSVRPGSCQSKAVDLGDNGEAHPAQIVALGDVWLVASGTPAETAGAKRGVYVVTPDGGVCPEPISGFEEHWTTDTGSTLQPFALAVTGDDARLAVAATVNPVRAPGDGIGKVLWATLSGLDDPCGISASVVDLTDGGPGHAPKSDPGVPTTWRRQSYAVVLHDVQG